MCGPPPFGELRVLTCRIRFTFFGAQESDHHKFFWLGSRRTANFSKKIRLLSKIDRATNCNCLCVCWELAQLLMAGTCMTARGVAFLNTLSDLSISSRNNSTVPRFLRIACCSALRVQVCSLICFVQVAYQHFNSLNNSLCPCLHAAYRIRAM